MAGVLISPMFKPVYGMLGTTFGGNHLACAAALAVMDVIEQDRLVENAANIGAYLLEELKKFPQIKEVRGCGLMIGMEFEQPVKEIRSRLIHEQKVFTDYCPLSASAKQKRMNSSSDSRKYFNNKNAGISSSIQRLYRHLFYIRKNNLPTVLSNETTSQNKV